MLNDDDVMITYNNVRLYKTYSTFVCDFSHFYILNEWWYFMVMLLITVNL